MDVYRTVLGDTFDKVALTVYGKESAMAMLVQANPEYATDIIFRSGVELICPDIPVQEDVSLPPWKRG